MSKSGLKIYGVGVMYDRLVVSGGGPLGLAVLGALHHAHEKGDLDQVTEYWGTSIGSVIILLLSIGYTPFEIFHQFFVNNNLIDPEHLTPSDLLAGENRALCKIEVFEDRVRSFLVAKLGERVDPTLFELWVKTGKKLHIIGANTDTMEGECFSVDTHPHSKVIDIIGISCDLPYFFT